MRPSFLKADTVGSEAGMLACRGERGPCLIDPQSCFKDTDEPWHDTLLTYAVNESVCNFDGQLHPLRVCKDALSTTLHLSLSHSHVIEEEERELVMEQSQTSVTCPCIYKARQGNFYLPLLSVAPTL